MNLFSYLEKGKIATRETLRIFGITLLVYVLGWFCWKAELIAAAYGFFLIALGGICNLYVISYNDCNMPIPTRNNLELSEFKKREPRRRLCMLNSKTRFKLLADRFPIGNKIWSIGDFLAIAGFVLYVLQSLQLFFKIIKI